ncbi:MAG: redoxin family protein [bacterium]
MVRYLIIVTGLALMLLAAACSTPSKDAAPQAAVYTEPIEVQELNDSLEAYAAATQGGDIDGYRAILEHFVAKYPNSTAMHRELQNGLDGFDLSAEKIAYYQDLLAQNPDSPMANYLLGRALSGPEAMPYFEKAVELDDNYFWGHFGLAYSYLSAEMPDTAAAIAEYQKCSEIEPSQPLPYRQLAGIYSDRGQYDQALEVTGKLMVTSPDDVTPYLMMSEYYTDQGDMAAAEQLLVDYAKAHVDNRRVRTELVDLYEKSERWADALVYRHELLQDARDLGEVTFELAKTYVKAGMVDSAVTYVDRAIDAGFANLRRLTSTPDLEPVRKLKTYVTALEKIKANVQKAREERKTMQAEGAEERKAESLADRLDTPAPEFSLVNLKGETVNLADLRGKVVVLDFWATWCGPCRMTMPLLQDFVDQKPAQVEFFSVNVWEQDTSLVRPFLAEYGYNFKVLFGGMQLPDEYGVTGIPTLFVIDKDGMIRYKHIGYSPYADQQLAWQTEALL